MSKKCLKFDLLYLLKIIQVNEWDTVAYVFKAADNNMVHKQVGKKKDLTP